MESKAITYNEYKERVKELEGQLNELKNKHYNYCSLPLMKVERALDTIRQKHYDSEFAVISPSYGMGEDDIVQLDLSQECKNEMIEALEKYRHQLIAAWEVSERENKDPPF